MRWLLLWYQNFCFYSGAFYISRSLLTLNTDHTWAIAQRNLFLGLSTFGSHEWEWLWNHLSARPLYINCSSHIYTLVFKQRFVWLQFIFPFFLSDFLELFFFFSFEGIHDDVFPYIVYLKNIITILKLATKLFPNK